MLDVGKLTEEFEPERTGDEFSPTEVDVEKDSFPESNIEQEVEEKGAEVEASDIRIREFSQRESDRPRIGIDGTSYVLGKSPAGAVGALRVAVVENDGSGKSLHKYGPYLLHINAKNKEEKYNAVRRKLFGSKSKKEAPSPEKTVDRMRSFLEKYIQLNLSGERRDSTILIDGSLIEGTVDSPMGFMERVVSKAGDNGNDIVGITKNTSLTLDTTRESVLSLLEGEVGPCAAYVKPHIKQSRNRYAGNIYVAKMAPRSDPFRVDIASERSDLEVLGQLSGLCGELGYPEELRAAHVHCKFSSIEIIELQAAAIDLFDLEFKDSMRKKLYGPWG